MDAKTLGAMPANPITSQDEKDTQNEGWGSLGLTKREAFAMAAMQGIIAGAWDEFTYGQTAERSAKYADTLLAELAKEQP